MLVFFSILFEIQNVTVLMKAIVQDIYYILHQMALILLRYDKIMEQFLYLCTKIPPRLINITDKILLDLEFE